MTTQSSDKTIFNTHKFFILHSLSTTHTDLLCSITPLQCQHMKHLPKISVPLDVTSELFQNCLTFYNYPKNFFSLISGSESGIYCIWDKASRLLTQQHDGPKEGDAWVEIRQVEFPHVWKTTTPTWLNKTTRLSLKARCSKQTSKPLGYQESNKFSSMHSPPLWDSCTFYL